MPNPDVSKSLTRSDTFLFGFLDPIGWKGIALRRIAPLIRHRPGEVLVNVMTNGLVRHGTNDLVWGSVNELFGDNDWRADLGEAVARLGSRDAAIIEIYLKRLKRAGDFSYVGSTRIRNPDKDRTYFHLAYGTRHPAGMEVFRRSEKRCVEVQEQVVVENYREKREREHQSADLHRAAHRNLPAHNNWHFLHQNFLTHRRMRITLPIADASRASRKARSVMPDAVSSNSNRGDAMPRPA